MYCRLALYSPNSSFTLSTSGVVGTYLPTPISLRSISPISTPSAWAVPPAARIGPQKSMERNSEPSALFMILTSPIPSRGATRTASVSTASPTLSPESMALRLSPVASCISFVTEIAIMIAAVSLSCFRRRSLNRLSIFNGGRLRFSGSMNRYGSSSNFSVLLAKSDALGISTDSEKSKPFFFATLAIA